MTFCFNKQKRWTTTKTAVITKMAAAIALTGVAAALAGSPAQAGWGPNGQYCNAQIQSQVPSSTTTAIAS
ncbi:hypothetical protein QY048_27580 [Bradyrhizobium sp. WYCCWR 12677]|uniref:hypothetical protein n=1 Tax=unclassified Bradyrhizobium TaxID=2631580 RepID=UPI00263B94F5|nr:hypothetical protein [Bradyrhizobium sp. WYCCWR 12677]MDN5004616.1 hypothetical protein [Bradyrhizobium sp. WYCCWR 12677]